MNLATAIALYCAENINQSSSGSSVINLPDKIVGPPLRDVARRRIVKTNPDVDSAGAKKFKLPQPSKKISPDSQADNSGFTGKRYRVQDHPGYGHLISEHDNEASAKLAALARPYSRVIQAPEWQFAQKVRDMKRKKVSKGGL